MDGEAGASVLPISIENIKSMNFQNKLSIGLTAAALLVTPIVNKAGASENWQPAGVAFDRQGNLFVADHAAGEILKFAPDATRSVFASEIKGAYGVAFDSDGNLFVSHPGEILKIAPDGTKSVFTREVAAPANVTVDGSGNVFVPDLRINAILKFTPAGKRSLAAANLINPAGPVFDRSGNLFAADDRGVYKIDSYLMPKAFATGVSALAMVFDQAGNLLVSDKGSGAILKFTPSGVKSTYASGVVPICFAFDANGNLLVSDRNSTSILKFAVNGTKTVFVSGSNRKEEAGAEPVGDEEAFQKALEYTRAVVEKQHLICLVDIESLNSGKKRSFRYDHYPEVERIQMKNDATFARKKDQHWLRSDDWAETGTKVNPNKSDELDALVEYPYIALDDKRSTHDPTQGAVVVRLIKREEVEDTQRLYYEEGREKQTGVDYPQFIFSKLKKEPDEKALLEGWAGLMRNGAERTHVNMNFSFLFQVNVQETTSGTSETPAPSAEEKPAAPIGGASAADSLTENAQIVSDNLAYSREYYSGVHFVAIASLPSSFAYDRYPDNYEERIRCDEGTFARQHPGQPWLKSNDWGRTGSPVDKGTAQKLENWIKLVNAAFVPTPASVKRGEKSEADGRVEWVFTAPSSDPKGAPTQFTFDKPTFDPNQNALLHGFTASLRLQDDKVVPGGASDRVRFSFGYLVPIGGGDELSERAWEDMQQPKAGASASPAPELKIGPSPKDAQGYVNRGDARGQYGDMAGAIADYRRAIELDPKSVPATKLESAYHNSGIVRFDRGAYDAAIADLSRAIELKPNDQDLYNDRGVAKWNQRDIEGAMSDYNQAIAINPKTAARVYRNRGLVKAAKGDKDGAIADYNQAIELEPQNAAAYDKRGELKRADGDLEGAIADFTAAIGLDPKLASAYKNRGDTKQAKGDTAGAQEDLNHVQQLNSGVTEPTPPTRAPTVALPAPEKEKTYGFQELQLHGKELAGKVVQVEVLPKAEHKTDLHDGRYCITLWDTKRTFGFVYCTKEGLQKMGFDDGTATKNQLIYVLMKKDKLSGTVFFAAVGTRFDAGNDGNASYSW
jgi:tetratricopeptide (TPR) repeat protein/DNA-binding beta-propeller fold protein YncE